MKYKGRQGKNWFFRVYPIGCNPVILSAPTKLARQKMLDNPRLAPLKPEPVTAIWIIRNYGYDYVLDNGVVHRRDRTRKPIIDAFGHEIAFCDCRDAFDGIDAINQIVALKKGVSISEITEMYENSIKKDA